MIIECQTCHARFRLDESRIKGKGARVRCRKCGDSIVVIKDGARGAPVPPAPVGDGFFDLRSAVRDSADESPGSPPPVGNLVPFPTTPSRPEKDSAPESSSPRKEAPEPRRGDMDLAFDRLLSAGAEASLLSITETKAEVAAPVEESGPMESKVPDGPGPSPDLDFGTLTLDLGPEEKLDLPSAVEPPTEFRGEGGFLISYSDTMDFPQEKHRDPESEAPAGIGDISLALSPKLPVETDSFLQRREASPMPPEDRASPFPEEISLEGNATPPAAPVIEDSPVRGVELPPPPPMELPGRSGSPAPESPRPRFSAGPAVAAVLAVLLAAGGYLGFTTSGRDMLEGAIPGLAALWKGKPATPGAAAYDLRNVIGYFESGKASPRILVIKGQVANLSKAEKSGIRVHATLLDNTDAVLAEQAVYAGNMLPGEAIRKGDRDTLLKTLGNRFGEGLANMSVAPDKAIPFMVVFFDAPATMDGYKLEAKDGE